MLLIFRRDANDGGVVRGLIVMYNNMYSLFILLNALKTGGHLVGEECVRVVNGVE